MLRFGGEVFVARSGAFHSAGSPSLHLDQFSEGHGPVRVAFMRDLRGTRSCSSRSGEPGKLAEPLRETHGDVCKVPGHHWIENTGVNRF